MTNTYKFAATELDILSKSFPDSENRPVIEEFRNEILALCEKFGQSGQSGGSAPYVVAALVQTVKLLLLQKSICPITGVDDEWGNCGGMGATDIDSSNIWQNRRCSALFKTTENPTPYFLDAIVFKSQNGATFTSNSKEGIEGISSSQYIKGFPFTPKTFYIDVISTEVKPDWWEYKIKDRRQLNRVWKYYRKPTTA